MLKFRLEHLNLEKLRDVFKSYISIVWNIGWKSIFIPVQKIDERHATVIYQFPWGKQRRRRRDADELCAKIDLRGRGGDGNKVSGRWFDRVILLLFSTATSRSAPNASTRERKTYTTGEGWRGAQGGSRVEGWMRVSLIQLARCLRFPS